MNDKIDKTEPGKKSALATGIFIGCGSGLGLLILIVTSALILLVGAPGTIHDQFTLGRLFQQSEHLSAHPPSVISENQGEQVNTPIQRVRETALDRQGGSTKVFQEILDAPLPSGYVVLGAAELDPADGTGHFMILQNRRNTKEQAWILNTLVMTGRFEEPLRDDTQTITGYASSFFYRYVRSKPVQISLLSRREQTLSKHHPKHRRITFYRLRLEWEDKMIEPAVAAVLDAEDRQQVFLMSGAPFTATPRAMQYDYALYDDYIETQLKAFILETRL